MAVNRYHDLRVWQQGMDLGEQVYRASGCFPKHEVYWLTNQMRRAELYALHNALGNQA